MAAAETAAAAADPHLLWLLLGVEADGDAAAMAGIPRLLDVGPGLEDFDDTAAVLSLVDLVLVANLLIIIIFAGYENFVSKINVGNHEDRPDWMGHVDFADLKMKLIGSIIAISGIELLKAFMAAGAYTNEQMAWKVGIHLTFVVTGVMFAVTDRLGGSKKHGAGG